MPNSSSSVDFVGFYHAPSSAACFSIFLLCLIYCAWILPSVGCKVVVPLIWSLIWSLPLVGFSCEGFLIGETGAYVLVGGAGSCLS